MPRTVTTGRTPRCRVPRTSTSYGSTETSPFTFCRRAARWNPRSVVSHLASEALLELLPVVLLEPRGQHGDGTIAPSKPFRNMSARRVAPGCSARWAGPTCPRANCDRGTDLPDCVALAPTAEELAECAPWLEVQDANASWARPSVRPASRCPASRCAIDPKTSSGPRAEGSGGRGQRRTGALKLVEQSAPSTRHGRFRTLNFHSTAPSPSRSLKPSHGGVPLSRRRWEGPAVRATRSRAATPEMPSPKSPERPSHRAERGASSGGARRRRDRGAPPRFKKLH